MCRGERQQHLQRLERSGIGVDERRGRQLACAALRACAAAKRPAYVGHHDVVGGHRRWAALPPVQTASVRIVVTARSCVRPRHRRRSVEKADRAPFDAADVGTVHALGRQLGNDPPPDIVRRRPDAQSETFAAEARNGCGGARGHARGNLHGLERDEFAGTRQASGPGGKSCPSVSAPTQRIRCFFSLGMIGGFRSWQKPGGRATSS